MSSSSSSTRGRGVGGGSSRSSAKRSSRSAAPEEDDTPPPDTVRLSDIMKRRRLIDPDFFKDDPYIPEEFIPTSFAECMLRDKIVPRTLLEIERDPRASHAFIANVLLSSDAASYSILALIVNTYEKARGLDPPPQRYTREEDLTGEIGGKI